MISSTFPKVEMKHIQSDRHLYNGGISHILKETGQFIDTSNKILTETCIIAVAIAILSFILKSTNCKLLGFKDLF